MVDLTLLGAPVREKRFLSNLLHEVESASSLDLTSDLAVELRGNAGRAARIDLSRFGREFREKLRIEVAYLLGWNVVTATWHLAIRTSKVHGSLFGFRSLAHNG